ncbi:MAG: hypothetical protein HY619_06085 [Thaumarchaeota archaeon]|nr:hypothetical protein [Nitrososphaerota archaeon]
MTAEKYTKEQAEKELKQARKLARSSQDYMKQAQMIARKLHKEELPDDDKLAGIYKRLISEEKNIAKMLKPSSRLERLSPRKKARTHC